MPVNRASNYEVGNDPRMPFGRSVFRESNFCRASAVVCSCATFVGATVFAIAGASLLAAAYSASPEDISSDGNAYFSGGLTLISVASVSVCGASATLIRTYLSWKRDLREVLPMHSTPKASSLEDSIATSSVKPPLPLPLAQTFIKEGFVREPHKLFIKEITNDTYDRSVAITNLD